MRTTVLTLGVVALLLGGAGTILAEAPDLEPGVMIQNGSNPLSVTTMSAAAVSDWNADGKKDLIIGDGGGYVWYFVNIGTDEAPAFNGGVKLQSGGSPILANYASG